MGVPTRRLAAAFLAVTLVSGCATGPTPAPATGAPGRPPVAASAAPSMAGQSGQPGPSGEPGAGLQPGPVDPSLAASWMPAVSLDPQQVGQQAAALGADLRQRVDAASMFGPEAADEEAGLDKGEADALTALRDQLKAKVGRAVPANARLAVYRPADPRRRAGADTGLLAFGWFLVLVMSGIAIGSFDPQVGDIPEVSFKEPFQETSDRYAVNVDATLAFSSTGGVVSASLTLTGTASTTVASSGRTVSTTGSTTYSFTINPCPDPGGGVSGGLKIADDETTSSPGRSTVGYRITGNTDYRVQVDDRAEIASTTVKTTWDEALTRSFDGRTRETDLALTSADSFDAKGRVAGAQNAVTIDNMDGVLTGDDGKAAAERMVTLGELTPMILGQFASEVWKGGKCFEVRPAPRDATVSTGSRTGVKVTVYHWVDKADVQLPVTATLTGVRSIEPSGQPVTSPATFTFTAGPPDSTGQVDYKVVSRRGISSATGTFKVEGDLALDISGTLKMNSGGVWTYDLRIAGKDIRLSAAADGTLTASGNVTVKGTARATVAPCRATINEKTGVQARGKLQGPEDAPVFHVQLGPTSLDTLGQTVHCPMITVPSSKGDYFGQWSTTIGYVDIPASGGTITGSGSTSGLLARQATGTFKASPRSR